MADLAEEDAVQVTTNQEVLNLNEKCGKTFGGTVMVLVCGRPKGHRPAKKHAELPTSGDIARTLRAPMKAHRA